MIDPLPLQSNSLLLFRFALRLKTTHHCFCAASAVQEDIYATGKSECQHRKHGPDVWQFRWSEYDLNGRRVYRKRVIGTVVRYPDSSPARGAVSGLLLRVNPSVPGLAFRPLTITQLCAHFEHHQLAGENSWRTFSTKKIYQAYLRRWVIPQWGDTELSAIKAIDVECWLRQLPLARSSCAKIRNLMSVLFDAACRAQLFDQNPIRLVRQSAKRRKPPGVLTAAEIQKLLQVLAIRERTVVLLAACTGLRQSELFGLKWSDLDFAEGTMNVTRSVVYGVAGPCKTEASQKPVPLHPLLADALQNWRTHAVYSRPSDWIFASKRHRGRRPLWGQAILRRYVRPAAEARWHRETLWLAHLQTHLLDASTERRDGIQGDARAPATFHTAIYVGHLHASYYAGETCSAGCRALACVSGDERERCSQGN